MLRATTSINDAWLTPKNEVVAGTGTRPADSPGPTAPHGLTHHDDHRLVPDEGERMKRAPSNRGRHLGAANAVPAKTEQVQEERLHAGLEV